MNKQEWEQTYTERNAKAEMWGAALAGIFMLPLILFAGAIVFVMIFG